MRKGLKGVTLWTASDVHPPLYFWLLWSWVQLAGESEFAMRMLSVSLGVLTVAVVYALGTLVANRKVGCLGALLTALARFSVWWSQEMRMYMLAGLLGMLSLYLFLRWLRAQDRPLRHRSEGTSASALLGLYALTSIGALYTIYLTAAFLLVENLVVLILLLRPSEGRRRLLIQWAMAQVTIAACIGTWLALSWGRMRTWSTADPFSLRLFVRLYATLLTTGVSVDIGRYLWPVVLPFAVVGLGIWCFLNAQSWPSAGDGSRTARHGTSWIEALTLLLTVILSVALIYLSSIPRGLFYTPSIEARYFLPFAPAFWVLLAWSVVVIHDRWRAAGWIAGTAIVALWLIFLPGYYRGRYRRDELQTMVRTILSQAERGDAVLLDSGGRYPIFLYYYDRFPVSVWRPPLLTISREERRITSQEVTTELAAVQDEHERVWLAEVDVDLADPDRLVHRWLDERYQQACVYGFGPNTLYLFDRQGRRPRLTSNGYVPQHLVGADVGTGGRLGGWELPIDTIPPASTAYISLLWDALPEEPVSLSLRNAQGQLLMQRQAESSDESGSVRQQFDFPVYPSTPADSYDVLLSPAPSTDPRLGVVRIVGTQPLPRALPPSESLSLWLGDAIALLGYTLRAPGGDLGRAEPADRLVLDLHWRTERKVERDLTVFTHLLSQAYNPRTQGPVWGQHDSAPADGGYPTTQWLTGQVIVDRHIIPIDAGAPPGVYQIEVGMYTWEDGQRLPVRSADGQDLGDRVLLGTTVQITGD